ncbi:DUF2917 domain-containing protein [Variovorax sp. JS1663]|uniref:DUF2917 domain-containing protein n=1 Tax=Variovorax sp. JS1663 TaxID=1851577 RepID=UPI000B34337E|nr:DUF2917 domain-containing protein [Variovorax sp. JS1663]OUL98043.1 hypothetical protein A8M77_33620 [Variovorax sp. JS1663]
MPTNQESFHLTLAKRGIFTLTDGEGVGIECRSGSVWITLDHDRRDIVLSPGERFVGDRHRRMLVSALEPAFITVSGSRPATPPARERSGSPWRLAARGMSPA